MLAATLGTAVRTGLIVLIFWLLRSYLYLAGSSPLLSNLTAFIGALGILMCLLLYRNSRD